MTDPTTADHLAAISGTLLRERLAAISGILDAIGTRTERYDDVLAGIEQLDDLIARDVEPDIDVDFEGALLTALLSTAVDVLALVESITGNVGKSVELLGPHTTATYDELIAEVGPQIASAMQAELDDDAAVTELDRSIEAARVERVREWNAGTVVDEVHHMTDEQLAGAVEHWVNRGAAELAEELDAEAGQ